MNGVQTRFKCKLDVKRCKRFVFPPSSLLPRSNALKTKAIRYFQTDRTLTRIVSPPLYKMESIIDILHKGGYSCVMKNREEVRTFTQRGVADLYDLYQADSAFMKGAAIADKVIGKGAAALMVLGGFKTVYADIISTPALALLCEAGIETTFAQEVPHIINRDKTGWCPLETACMELNTVEEMYPVIQNFISRIRAK